MDTACPGTGCIQEAKLDQRGFTLLELMVAVAMVGILAGLAIATMQTGNFRVKNAAENLVADLNRVRATAIRDNQNITVSIGSDSYNATEAGLQVTLPSSLAIDSHFSGSLTFDSLGAAPNALNGYLDVELASDNATQCRVQVNNAGRIWIDTCQL